MSTSPAMPCSLRATILSCKTHAPIRPSSLYGIRTLPLARVGRTFTLPGRVRDTTPGITVTSTPAAAKPRTCCQAV